MALAMDHLPEGMYQDVKRKGNWMQAYPGVQFWPLDPKPEEIHIETIAHALSQQCRYGGHSKHFFSVAEHCFLVSHETPKQYALEGLLHDAAEAYLVDIPRPIKVSLSDYKEIEQQLEQVIAQRFGLVYPWPQEVIETDHRILKDEMLQVMNEPPASWGLEDVEPLGIRIMCYEPKMAEHAFINRFKMLMNARK